LRQDHDNFVEDDDGHGYADEDSDDQERYSDEFSDEEAPAKGTESLGSYQGFIRVTVAEAFTQRFIVPFFHRIKKEWQREDCGQECTKTKSQREYHGRIHESGSQTQNLKTSACKRCFFPR